MIFEPVPDPMSESHSCPSCGDDLFMFAPIVGSETGEEYHCENESCEYVEKRYYD
jgi:hypothetical protein